MTGGGSINYQYKAAKNINSGYEGDNVKRICLLVDTTSNIEFKNYRVLANALYRAGFVTYLGLVDSMHLDGTTVYGNCFHVERKIEVADTIEEGFEVQDLTKMNWCWVHSFGKRELFLDYIEILWILSKATVVVNSIEALMFVKSKYSVPLLCPENFPTTYASSNFEYLWAKYSENRNKTWIIKSPAESRGRDVFLLKPGDKNAKVIIQSMTGNRNNKFCLLQQYIKEIEQGEKRILLAGGEVICYYARKSSGHDHRTNLHQEGQAFVCELTKNERGLLDKLASKFLRIGAYFVGVDLAYPYIVELNVTSPGGLKTVEELTGTDYSNQVIDKVIASVMIR